METRDPAVRERLELLVSDLDGDTLQDLERVPVQVRRQKRKRLERSRDIRLKMFARPGSGGGAKSESWCMDLLFRRETAAKQRCCTGLACQSLTAACARLALRARAPMLVAHRRRREINGFPHVCSPMAVRWSPCDPSSCTDLISSQTTFYLSQTRAESLVLTWSVFSTAPPNQVPRKYV